LADLQKRCFVLPKGKRRLSQGNVFLIGDLQLELGPAPMSPLRIVPNGIAGPHPDPIRNRTILFQLLRQLLFNPKGFKRRHNERNSPRERTNIS